MRNRPIYLTAVLVAGLAAVAAIFVTSIASPTDARFSSAPIHDAPLDDFNIPGVPGNIDYGVPNLNSVDKVIPNVDVPNINLPNIKVNPGHVGLPGRGR